jgi:hypothetical protein
MLLISFYLELTQFQCPEDTCAIETFLLQENNRDIPPATKFRNSET